MKMSHICHLRLIYSTQIIGKGERYKSKSSGVGSADSGVYNRGRIFNVEVYEAHSNARH